MGFRRTFFHSISVAAACVILGHVGAVLGGPGPELILPDVCPGDPSIYAAYQSNETEPCEEILDSSNQSYVDITLLGIPDGFSVRSEKFLGWCVDLDGILKQSDFRRVDLYSSLEPPGFLDVEQEVWNKINWILNNKDLAMDGETLSWLDIQAAIWILIEGYFPDDFPFGFDGYFGDGCPQKDGPRPDESIVDALLAEAEENVNFTPEPGDSVSIIVVPINDSCEPIIGANGTQVIIIEASYPAGPCIQVEKQVCMDFKDPVDGCSECDGKVTQLTLQYNGSKPSAIRVTQKRSGVVFSDDRVEPGDSFTFKGRDKKGSLGTEISIYVDGVLNTKIHTSCSQPIGPGLVFGDFEVVEGYSRNGGLLCSPVTDAQSDDDFEDPSAGPGKNLICFDADTIDAALPVGDGAEYKLVITNCGQEDLEDIVISDPDLGIRDFNLEQELGIEVLSAGESITLTAHDIPSLNQPNLCEGTFPTGGGEDEDCGCEGKVTDLTLKYSGAIADAMVEVRQKSKKRGQTVFSGTIQPGDWFSFSGRDKNGTLGTDIDIFVDGAFNTRIHTSCSRPIFGGMVSGDFEVIGGSSLKGGPLCPRDRNDGDCEKDDGHEDYCSDEQDECGKGTTEKVCDRNLAVVSGYSVKTGQRATAEDVAWSCCTFGQGCTPGFWKQRHHLEAWTIPYGPQTLFSEVFEDAFPGETLLDVLRNKGGGLNALGRHTVSALLNASNPTVAYPLTDAEVIGLFNEVFPGGNSDYETLKDYLEAFNEAICPLGRSYGYNGGNNRFKKKGRFKKKFFIKKWK